MVVREKKALVVRVEKINGLFRKKQEAWAHIFLDFVAGEIIILASDDNLRQKIRARIANLKNNIKDRGILVLEEIKNTLLDKKTKGVKGVVIKEVKYLTPNLTISFV